uniref:Uncharacterized protein n=1 Tax=Guillardia theta TaxID=55529 RepID=A0A7S4P4P6_GUITH
MASSSSSLPPDVICRLDFFLTRLVVHSRIHNLQEILEIKLLVAISVMLEHLLCHPCHGFLPVSMVQDFHDLVLVDCASSVLVVDHKFNEVEQALRLASARALSARCLHMLPLLPGLVTSTSHVEPHKVLPVDHPVAVIVHLPYHVFDFRCTVVC